MATDILQFFKRPDKFSRNAIEKMMEIHDLFPAALSTYYVEPENAQYPIDVKHKEFIRNGVTGEGREMLNGVFLFRLYQRKRYIPLVQPESLIDTVPF